MAEEYIPFLKIPYTAFIFNTLDSRIYIRRSLYGDDVSNVKGDSKSKGEEPTFERDCYILKKFSLKLPWLYV